MLPDSNRPNTVPPNNRMATRAAIPMNRASRVYSVDTLPRSCRVGRKALLVVGAGFRCRLVLRGHGAVGVTELVPQGGAQSYHRRRDHDRDQGNE